ncbi:integrase arm-type DNA-binding domain-containing protein [uncultured Thiothrix sp.]|uniref:tyrosine-type recombinase/integrase n=1 Tax=uncultured Thiothrix sp. TaxID=223185 RepID=UPI002638A10C|nr:integrase arm-type DNA-binding domain-containing protein [uncultured Thiothrix sp.]
MNKKLKDSTVKNAKPEKDGSPATYADGGGLLLYVTKTGKYWRYRYRIEGKPAIHSLGNYPEMSLKEAREQHEEARALVARGINPNRHKQRLQALECQVGRQSFQVIALEWVERNKSTWSEGHFLRVNRYLQNDTFPWIGQKNINKISPAEITRLVQRIEARGAGDAARRVKQYISQVYKHAISLELAERNPTVDLDNNIIFKPRSKKPFATLTDPVKVGQLLRDIDHFEGTLIVRCALQLSALVMLRPGELRAAEWSEIDLDQALWTIPIKRMKAPTHEKQANLSSHIIPLSTQAVAVLRELYPYTGRSTYVFPNARGASRCMSENAVRAALRTLGYDNDTMTPHGFRGMASTLLNRMREQDTRTRLWDMDLIEQQLAHRDNSIRGRYNRADSSEAIHQRREMLQAWADYLDELRAGGQIVAFRKAK